MSDYMTNINSRQMLEIWENAGMIEPNESVKLEQFIQEQQQEKEIPLHLRIFVGIGAFIASTCFLSFLVISKIISFDSEAELIFWGLILVGGALFLAKISGDKYNTIKHSFFIQSSFCAMSVGKILFISGSSIMFDSYLDGITLSALIITVATYHVYRMSIDRFLSTLTVFIMLFINIMSKRYFNISVDIVMNIFFLIQIILTAFLMTNSKIKRAYIPLAYSVAFSLFLIIIFFSVEAKIGQLGGEHHTYSLAFVNATLTLSLIGLIGWAAGNLKKLKTEPLMIASLGSILLGIISAPGVLLSICLMILGYAKHEKLLLLMGLLLMPVFIFLYYHNLSINLMAKSVVLVGSGIILLIGRGYLAAKKLDREVI